MLNFLAWKQNEKKNVHIKEGPYKEEPAKELNKEFEEVADRFKIDPPPVPPEVEQ